MSFRTIEWRDDAVIMIDQTRLPMEEVYQRYTDFNAVAEAIKGMVVRGAPAIGVAAAMGVALGAREIIADTQESFFRQLENVCDVMARTRPTAVNLFWAIERMKQKALSLKGNPLETIRTGLKEEAIRIEEEDLAICKDIGRHGAELIPEGATILTHCNAGGLATAGYGTALGVIRAAHEAGKKIQVFSDETRPWLQGARLTTWELMKDSIPVTLISDNMAGFFMSRGEITCCVVGADRIPPTAIQPTRSAPSAWRYWPENMASRSMWRRRSPPLTCPWQTVPGSRLKSAPAPKSPISAACRLRRRGSRYATLPLT